jgi:hypothetical protein
MPTFFVGGIKGLGAIEAVEAIRAKDDMRDGGIRG